MTDMQDLCILTYFLSLSETCASKKDCFKCKKHFMVEGGLCGKLLKCKKHFMVEGGLCGKLLKCKKHFMVDGAYVVSYSSAINTSWWMEPMW